MTNPAPTTELHGAAYLTALPDDVLAPLARIARLLIDTTSAEKRCASRHFADLTAEAAMTAPPEMVPGAEMVAALAHALVAAERHATGATDLTTGD